MEVHILNGDALKAQFPSSVSGELLVMRECLVDGAVSGDTLTSLLQTRATFFEKTYGVSQMEYQRKTISEIEKIKQITEETTVHLWFEDDLFCQVNLWFTAHLLLEHTQVEMIYLVRPDAEHRYGFGGMSANALIQAYQDRQLVSRSGLQMLATLWKHYQTGKHDALLTIAEVQKETFPFLLDAVIANRDRFPTGRALGRPQRTLLEITDQLGRDDFGPVFREFWKREGIYGFGDLQVKRMWEALKAN